jgi:hypothetical protein
MDGVRPVPRTEYLIGKLLGLWFILCVTAIFIHGLLASRRSSRTGLCPPEALHVGCFLASQQVPRLAGATPWHRCGPRPVRVDTAGSTPRAVLDNWDRFTPSGPRRSLRMARRDRVRVPRALRSTGRCYLDIAAHCCSLRDRCRVQPPGAVAPRSRHAALSNW